MFPWKRKAEQPLATEDDLPGFTGAQRARLTSLRAHLRSRDPACEIGLDARRLQFARWLVRRGRLSEGMDGQEAAWAPQLSQAPHLLRTALASGAMAFRSFTAFRRSHPRSPVEATIE